MTVKKKALMAIALAAAMIVSGFVGAMLSANSHLNCEDGWTRHDAPDHRFDMCVKTFKF